MKHRASSGYNRHEIVRGIWKGIMVPGLTFGTAALCLRSGVQAGLEINQRAVGRLASGAHGKTTHKAVQGDMGWASFEAQEAKSKILHEERLRKLDDKWATKVFKYLYRKGSLDTHWRKKTAKLASKYVAHQEGEIRNFKRQVKNADGKNWIDSMEKKQTLDLYRKWKRQIKKELFYDNSRGNALLFETRSGCLRTWSYKKKFNQEDHACAACGKSVETIEYLLLECGSSHPGVDAGTVIVPEALGFRDEKGNVNKSTVDVSKKRLEDWWLKSRAVT